MTPFDDIWPHIRAAMIDNAKATRTNARFIEHLLDDVREPLACVYDKCIETSGDPNSTLLAIGTELLAAWAFAYGVRIGAPAPKPPPERSRSKIGA